jgi:hypothetical protein
MIDSSFQCERSGACSESQARNKRDKTIHGAFPEAYLYGILKKLKRRPLLRASSPLKPKNQSRANIETGTANGGTLDRYNIVSESDLMDAARKIEQNVTEFRHKTDIIENS